MIAPSGTSLENLTLSDADLAACQPLAGEGGHVLRALCPFHGSDHQRSLRVTVATGRFVCFACGAWGYLEDARQRWREEHQRLAALRRPPARLHRPPSQRQEPPPSAAQPAPAGPQPRALAPPRSRTWRSTWPRSRRPCRGAAARRICASAASPWRWRSSTAWAMRRRAPGRTPRGTGAAAAWSSRTPRRRGAW